MKISNRGIALIKQLEGFRGRAYLCPAGVPTIGYGTTKGVTFEDVQQRRTITEAQAEELLVKHLHEYEKAVSSACAVKPNQNQFDALVSFAFNVGCRAMRNSSVTKAHNRGDFSAAARAFGLWTKARIKGRLVELPGLVRRRALEAALYLEPVHEEYMPQAIVPEKPMAESRINRASILAGGTAMAASWIEVMRIANSAKTEVENLGSWFVPLALLGVVVLCGYIIFERYRQRREGRA